MKHPIAWTALRESCLKHMEETFSSIYIYIHKDTAAEAGLLKIPSCSSMTDESLTFSIPTPQNTKPSVSGREITSGATQRSPNQAKRFSLPLPIKTRALRYISCKFLTDGAVTSCYRASPLRWGCAAEMMPRGCLSPHAPETGWRRRRLSSVKVLMSCSSPGDPGRQLTPCETHPAPLRVYRGTSTVRRAPSC